MRDSAGMKYFLTDHLGSVNVTLSATGTVLSQQRYLPFGGVRTLSGTNVPNPNVPGTDFGYTSQRALPETGLMDFKARMYDPYLNRFIQPDTLIPSAANPQAFNRYSYVLNRPINFNDPTGHNFDCGVLTCPEDMQGSGNKDNRDDGNERCIGVACMAGPSGVGGGGDDDGTDEDFISSISENYMLGWENFGQAWSIFWNPNATFDQTIVAGGYMWLWGGAHIAGAAASAYLLRAGIIAIGAELATHNPDALNTVIGGYPEYVNFAKETGNTYFDLGNAYKILNAVGLAKPVNDQFIANQITQAKNFLQISVGSGGTAAEVKTIIDVGYIQMASAWSSFVNIFSPTAIGPE